MDPHRFDRLSRAFADGLTRRQMVGGLGAGGLAAALFGSRVGAAQSGDVRTCTYDFTATIDIGPGSHAKNTRDVVGELRLTIGPDGAIDQGTLVGGDGAESAVVGQAVGRAISLRISVAANQTLVAVGTAQFPVVGCKGPMGGPLTGPRRHDVGDWSAAPKKSGPSPTPVSTPSAAATAVPVAATVVPDASPPPPSTVTSASTCDLHCGADTGGLDQAACVCVCPAGMVTCVAEIGSIPGKGGVIFNVPPVKVRTGYCVDVSTDSSHCGACGQLCAFGEHVATVECVAGACVQQCKANYATCAGGAPCGSDLATDKTHCGACGTVCPGNQTCVNFACVCALQCGSGAGYDPNVCTCICDQGQTSCGSYCAVVATDPQNCGACGTVCPPFLRFCQGGGCAGEFSPAG